MKNHKKYVFLQINTYYKVWEDGKSASWFIIYLIKQETKDRNEDASCALNFMSDAEDNEEQTTDSLHENSFLGHLKCLGWYSFWCEFFTFLVEMDTDKVLIDNCFEYVDDLI